MPSQVTKTSPVESFLLCLTQIGLKINRKRLQNDLQLFFKAIVCLVDLVFFEDYTLHIHSTFVILLGKIDHKVRENFSSDFYVSIHVDYMQNFTPPILCNNEREHQQPHLRTKNYHTRNHIF